ncbi:hypothetical protein BKA70DRAFT_1275375 [Coprinopsis sp. MPI-PUGE-AT-0042]|nr:hypothetical protein BKA70DRAFT_1275375 [Coprinopsis sp. MPI-PUGE-AT-0042]
MFAKAQMLAFVSVALTASLVQATPLNNRPSSVLPSAISLTTFFPNPGPTKTCGSTNTITRTVPYGSHPSPSVSGSASFPFPSVSGSASFPFPSGIASSAFGEPSDFPFPSGIASSVFEEPSDFPFPSGIASSVFGEPSGGFSFPASGVASSVFGGPSGIASFPPTVPSGFPQPGETNTYPAGPSDCSVVVTVTQHLPGPTGFYTARPTAYYTARPTAWSN